MISEIAEGERTHWLVAYLHDEQDNVRGV